MRGEIVAISTQWIGLVMLAEISSGNLDTADVFFLIATIVFVLAAIAVVVPNRHRGETVVVIPWATVLGYIGLAFTALALLVL